MPSGNSFPNSTFSWSQGTDIVTGNTFFVDSGNANASSNTEGTRNKPFDSIENVFASGYLTANNGDRIIVMPGHVETVSADGGTSFDVAGVDVIGLGRGSARPTISYTTAAAAACTVTGANTLIRNFLCSSAIADCTNAFDVTAADVWFDQVEFVESAADLNFVDYINCSSTTDNTADGLKVTNCRGTAIDAAQNSFILTAADIDKPHFTGNYYSSDHANTLAFFEVATGKTVTDVYIVGNYMYTGATGDVGGIANGDQTDNTGIVAHNRIGHHDTAGEVLCDLDGVRQFDNLGTATDTASGYVLPAIDS